LHIAIAPEKLIFAARVELNRIVLAFNRVGNGYIEGQFLHRRDISAHGQRAQVHIIALESQPQSYLNHGRIVGRENPFHIRDARIRVRIGQQLGNLGQLIAPGLRRFR
jgi:hypothetical protein